MDKPTPLTITSSGNLMEDVYNAFSIRASSLTNNRPIWTVTFSVDQISFFIGALGGVGIGYFFNQYEPSNIDNPDYINKDQDADGSNNGLMGLVNHIVYNPIKIMHRFFVSGSIYCLCGLATYRMFRKGGWGRSTCCGGLTGLYFSYGSPFTQLLKATGGMAMFSLFMEGIFSFIMR